MYFSLIIPVYNRPEDMREVLQGLSLQTCKNFEVIVVESGSTIKSDKVVEDFSDKLTIRYFYKANEGQGLSRNYGMERAEGEYFIILDSDIIIPIDYIAKVNDYLNKNYLDAYGGPDRAHPSFTPTQKAIDFALTSYLTTGGTRGRNKQAGNYYPRSFNMGFSREVYQKTNGFKLPNCGEDIELSIRVQQLGFKSGLIEKAYVYHKRKKSLPDFFKQMVWFGRSRVNIYRIYPESLKLIHLLPVCFLIYLVVTLLLAFISMPLFLLALCLVSVYLFLVFAGAFIRYKSVRIGLLSIATAVMVFVGYGWGFIRYFLKK